MAQHFKTAARWAILPSTGKPRRVTLGRMLKGMPTVLFFGALAAAPAIAQPDAFWCGSRLIREGMRATEITERCGKPDAVEVVEQPVMARNADGRLVRTGTKRIEHWTYDRGSRRFPARITVDEGIAIEVALLSRN